MIAGAVRGLVATNERLRKQYCQQWEVQKMDIGMQLVHFILSLYTGWAKKTGLFSDLITLWRLVLETRAVCQNFRNFIEKKGTKLAFQWLLIFFAKFAQIVTTGEIMVYMTRTHGFYSIYTNIHIYIYFMSIRLLHKMLADRECTCCRLLVDQPTGNWNHWKLSGRPGGWRLREHAFVHRV